MAADYKIKYEQLKANFISTVQKSYALGLEAGLQQAQMQNLQQQASDAQAQLQALQNPQVDANGQPMQPGQDPNAPQDPSQNPNAQNAQQQDPNAQNAQPAQFGQSPDDGSGTELDNHLNELEGLVAKGEKPSLPELRKKIEEITGLRKAQKQPAKQAKQVESSQKQLLNSILKSWKQEAPKVSNSIADIIAQAEAKVK